MNNLPQKGNLRIGIDIGGTFTDFVIYNPQSGEVQTFKLPSTPHNPSEAVLSGLKKSNLIPDPFSDDEDKQSISIIHGTTVATNTLLEQKGASTALVTTSGFKDVLQIGRQNRPELYDFRSEPVKPLIPEELRFELEERVNHLGEVLVPLDLVSVHEMMKKLNMEQDHPIQSVAVVFLFSFLNPEHEQFVSTLLRDLGYFVSASNEILPEFREYERTSTTVVNAYVSPILNQYLQSLEENLLAHRKSSTVGQQSKINQHKKEDVGLNLQEPTIRIQIMQSNGGRISMEEARKSGVRCILSGPAGGVVGSRYIAKNTRESRPIQKTYKDLDLLQLLTFDMGGTSTDVSIIQDELTVTTEAVVGGHPIRVPVLDIHTIGAGGGSIAYQDSGGLLRVGPKSAGAFPGPACYGNQDLNKPMFPTVTDANLLLGRIPSDFFLGGNIALFPQLAERSISALSKSLGLDPIQTALGIIEITNIHMERALRVVSVERGNDPREFTLLSFGGAGGLHAVELARNLEIPQVLIPPIASVLSAFGMLVADVVKDYTQTIMVSKLFNYDDIRELFRPMIEKARYELMSEGFSGDRVSIDEFVDIRYKGQSYELTIPFSSDYRDQFHLEHLKTFGYKQTEAVLEIVNIRVRATGKVPPPKLVTRYIQDNKTTNPEIETRPVVFPDGIENVIFYRGELLTPGLKLNGPCIIVRNDTTILIGCGDQAIVDPYANLIININHEV